MNNSNYTKEQSDTLEVTYEVMYDELRKALSLLNMMREGLINAHGELNKNIKPYDIDYTPQTIQELLKPVTSEICEASCNADYFFWGKEHKSKYAIWDTVDKVLKIVRKEEVA